MARMPAIALLILCLLLPTGAFAEKHVALVIGYSEYKLAQLGNPRNDAHDVTAALPRLGFDVTERKNQTVAAFDLMPGKWRAARSPNEISQNSNGLTYIFA